MSEFMPEQPKFEVEQDEPTLDKVLIVSHLQGFGVDIELADLVDEDDNDVLGIIATYALMHDFDMDDVLREVTPIESRRELEQ